MCYRFIFESVRWLTVKGRHEESLEILKKIGRFNGNEILEEEEELILVMRTKSQHHSGNNFDGSCRNFW